MSQFELSDWISCGKTWPDDPPLELSHAVGISLTVPAKFRHPEPEPSSTVAELLQWPTPGRYLDDGPETTYASCFTTDQPRELSMDDLFLVPMPGSKEVILRLRKAWNQAFLDGKTSLVDWRYFCRGKPYPPWLIAWWYELYDAVQIKVAWQNSQKFLVHLRSTSPESGDLADEASESFKTLPWMSQLNGAASRELQTGDLSSLLGRSMLRQNIVNGILLLLKERVHRALVSDVEVCDLNVMDKLRQGIDWAAYEHNPFDSWHRWIRRLAETLVRQQTRHIFLPIYHSPHHWAVFWINLDGNYIQYGDSKQWIAPTSDIDILCKWFKIHDISLHFNGDFPIGLQVDDYSCGIAMVNAIEHAVFKTPLWSQENADFLRTEKYLDLYNSHTEREGSEMIRSAKEAVATRGPLSLGKSSTQLLGKGRDIHMDTDLINSHHSNGSGISDKDDLIPKAGEQQKTRLNLRIDQNAPKRGLLQHFQLISKAQWDAQTHDKAMSYKDERQAYQEREALKMVHKATKITEQNRERQRQKRERDREAEIEAGERSPGGTKKKRRVEKVVELQDKSGSSSSTGNIAALSWPHRDFKEDARANRKPQGRKPPQKKQPAKKVNWFQPLLWRQIELSAKRVGPGMGATEIVRDLKLRVSDGTFDRLIPQTVGKWIDKSGSVPRWKERMLYKAAKGNRPGGYNTRKGVLTPYPALVESIRSQLTSLRNSGIATPLLICRSLMIAQIEHFEPGLFKKKSQAGLTFQCTDSFVRKFLHSELKWSERAATRAAQKVPLDAPQQIRSSYLRQALSKRDYNIPASLQVNADQQQITFQLGAGDTWAPTGSKQVAVIGQEEKRAFTLLVSVSASGELLPFQAIWDGKTKKSLPKPPKDVDDEARKLGFRFVVSGTDNYWSTFKTMCDYVTNILVPYYNLQKQRLDLAADQECIFQIDVWSVHRSVAFRTWINIEYSYIIVDYFPGGCTGLFQPCDLGVQRPVKHSIKHSQHADMVREALALLDSGTKPEEVKLDTRKSIFCDRSVSWLIKAYHAVNKPNIIKKAFELCKVLGTDFNLSHESLTSRASLQLLRDVQKNEPELWATLNQPRSKPDAPLAGESGLDVPENDLFHDKDTAEDDSNIPLETVILDIQGEPTASIFSKTEDGKLVSAAEIEGIEKDEFDHSGDEGMSDDESYIHEGTDDGEDDDTEALRPVSQARRMAPDTGGVQDLRRGERSRRANRHYDTPFWEKS